MEDLARRLKKLADEYGMVDVGEGAAEMLGVTQRELDRALAMLCADEYSVCRVCFPQVTVKMGNITTKMLCRPDMDLLLRTNFNVKVHHIIYSLND